MKGRIDAVPVLGGDLEEGEAEPLGLVAGHDLLLEAGLGLVADHHHVDVRAAVVLDFLKNKNEQKTINYVRSQVYHIHFEEKTHDEYNEINIRCNKDEA